MCGIFGLYNVDLRPASEKQLRSVGDRMLFRGPDGEGYFVDGPFGFGMRRLAIIDVDGGSQPICNEEGNIHVICNGEIYNHRELRQGLEKRGHKFRSNSDVETIVHLYEELGPACVHELNGMFAIAVWDARERRLWLSRDRLGIKPLFWYFDKEQFFFSSDLKAMNAQVRQSVCQKAFVQYLGNSYVPGPDTFFENIKKLMPGHELKFDGNAVHVNQYWSPTQKANISETDSAIERLESLFQASVKMQLQSDVPVGVFLSGGIDSSAVAAFAKNVSASAGLRSYTVNFEGKGGADHDYASIISSELGSEHVELRLDSKTEMVLLNEVLTFIDEPVSDNALLPSYALSRRAAEDGVKVLLSGAGADEIFGGYNRYFQEGFGSSFWFSGLPSSVGLMTAPLWKFYNPALKERFKNRSRNFFISTSGANLAMLSEILLDDGQFSALVNSFDSFENSLVHTSPSSLMNADLVRYLPDNILALTDKATMSASVECRVPFLDHRIVELANALPDLVKVPGQQRKGMLIKMLQNRLPSNILKRQKEGFNAPTKVRVSDWLVDIRAELLHGRSSFLDKMINPKKLERWLTNPKLVELGSETIYALFIANKWLRMLEQND